MSQESVVSLPQALRQSLARPMRARGADEPNRTSTSLELFFDLCFVVAVAQAGTGLEHSVGRGAFGSSLVGYTTVFFAIWWAWMNFTWFASTYDNDDGIYRLAVLVQIAGALILAAGVPRGLADRDTSIIVVGYVVMRVSLVSLWIRAARGDPERRRTDLRYALGVSVCMVGWAGILALPGRLWTAAFVLMALAELLVPVWAEAAGTTTSWHPGHIAERYGLFTLIVLGESVAAATVAIQSALDAGVAISRLAEIAGGGLLIVFSMWWLYFAQPTEQVMEHARSSFGLGASAESFVWGYGHYFVFSSAAAVGAGLVVAVDQATGHADIAARTAVVAVAVPVALYVVTVCALHARAQDSGTLRTLVALGTAALVIGAALVGLPIPVIGILVAGLVGFMVASTVRSAD